MFSITELPVVICNVQRGGPSTGLPTKHEQSDLYHAALGGHGDAPRIVLSAENVQDCYDLTIEAFKLAEKYQVPVILLTDGSLGFRTESIPTPDMKGAERARRKFFEGPKEGEPYLRYGATKDNISPVAKPGTPGGRYISPGLEHGEKGAPQYDPANRNKMMAKGLLGTSFAILSVALLLAGGLLMVTTASKLARALGISHLTIGVILVAFSTTLPELAASATSAYHKNSEISVANVIGSNNFNILVCVGFVALLKPIAVNPAALRVEFPVAFVFYLLLLLMFKTYTGI